MNRKNHNLFNVHEWFGKINLGIELSTIAVLNQSEIESLIEIFLGIIGVPGLPASHVFPYHVMFRLSIKSCAIRRLHLLHGGEAFSRREKQVFSNYHEFRI